MASDFAARDFAAGSAPLTLSYPAAAGKRYRLSGVAWSVQSGEVAGAVSVRVDGDLVFQTLVTRSGHDAVYFGEQKQTPVGVEMEISLSVENSNLGGSLFALGMSEVDG